MPVFAAFRAVFRESYFWKTGGRPKSEAPKQKQNFQNHRITDKDPICSKQLKLKEKLLSSKLSKCYPNAIKKHWSNTGQFV